VHKEVILITWKIRIKLFIK